MDEQFNSLRLIRFALYRAMGFGKTASARRAGYAETSIRNSEFLDALERRVAEQGIIADIEIPLAQLLHTQVSLSFATLVHLRDHSESEKVRVDAAKHLLALAGYSPQTAVKSGPDEEALKEIASWTRDEQKRYLTFGQVPQRLELPPETQEVQEQPAQEAEVDPEHPHKGMLA